MILKIKSDTNITFQIPENFISDFTLTDQELQDLAMFQLQREVNKIGLLNMGEYKESKDDEVKVVVEFGNQDVSESKLATQLFLLRSVAIKILGTKDTGPIVNVLMDELTKEITEGSCSWAFK